LRTCTAVHQRLVARSRIAQHAFSETALQIFSLMASRPLKSDRFFTDDYRPEVYTSDGIGWIEDTDMRAVILRHSPDVAAALQGVENAFAPWRVAEA